MPKKPRPFQAVRTEKEERAKQEMLEGLEVLRASIESGETVAYVVAGKTLGNQSIQYLAGHFTFLEAMGMVQAMDEFVKWKKNCR